MWRRIDTRFRPLALAVVVGAGITGAACGPGSHTGGHENDAGGSQGDANDGGPDRGGDADTARAFVDLSVRETGGVGRSEELVQNGVPLPRTSDVRDIAHLAVVDDRNVPVPAEFRVLSRWNAGKADPNAPIQWVLVSFLASLSAGGNARYRLRLDAPIGTNPAPTTPLALERDGARIVVNTGAATFDINPDTHALFGELRDANGRTVARGVPMTATVAGAEHRHTTTRRVLVEHVGPLTASVLIEGAYGAPAVGGGGIGSKRRYLFAAGSSTAVVRHAFAWEGRRCGDTSVLTCAEGVNGLLVERVRDAMVLEEAPTSVVVMGARGQAPVVAAVTATQEASLVQNRRTNRTSAPSFVVTAPATPTQTGTEATAGLLSVATTRSRVAVGLKQMHRYEPQALRLLANGHIAIDLAADGVWLGNRQGLYATMAVNVVSASDAPSAADLERALWGRLNRPLRAWPDAAWFSGTGVVEELPHGELDPDLRIYDDVVRRVLTRTNELVAARGLSGLGTFGLFPRYWGTRDGDELDCSGTGTDPTPNERWDDTYWCATWTDYHNTSATAALWAMRSGEVEWIDDIAIPAAHRSLHTQVLQCAPEDTFFYCGQAPAGYRGYRSDFNSSHAYLQNAMLYYFLTGDSFVVDTLQRGAAVMRNYFCPGRNSGGPPCAPTAVDSEVFVGRVISQWEAIFRFVGQAGNDASFLQDFRATLARAATQNYAELKLGDRSYGFWTGTRLPTTLTNIQTDQLWMTSLYDMRNLYRLQLDTDDAPIGEPGLRPSQIHGAWARTLLNYGTRDGSAAGQWNNTLFFDGSGGRIDGTLLAVRPDTVSSEPILYDPGKACLVAVLARAGRDSGDSTMLAMARELALLALRSAMREDAPLGKAQGEYLTTMHAAIAILDGRGAP